MILEGILSLINSFKRVHQKDFHTGWICTAMSSFFPFFLKQRPLFEKLEKTKEVLFAVFWEKKYITKNQIHFFMRIFFHYEWETDVSSVIKK